MPSNGSSSPQRGSHKRSKWDLEEEQASEKSRGPDLDAKEAKAKAAATAARKKVKPAAQASLSVPSETPAQSRESRGVVPDRGQHLPLQSCRSVHCFERLNHIEEGSYGVVYRARDKDTGEVVALKRLKMDREKNGFPITSLREIRTLMEAAHENVVSVREIVVGDTLTQIFIVMEFVEHDLKTLLATQRMPFLASEIKTLMHQLLSAMSLLHRNWIIHRDIKTSNLLMNNRGQIKLADFGLARMYGDPRGGDLTDLVVTLWYRAPELLLGAKTYDTAIDMWSVGCIFAELITKEPLFPGKNETDQIAKIFRLLGQPNDSVWPGFSRLPNSKAVAHIAQPFSNVRQVLRFSTDHCVHLLQALLTYDPTTRITADEALQHPYFSEAPAPAHPNTFGSFPSVAAGEMVRRASPDAPERLANTKLEYQLELDI